MFRIISAAITPGTQPQRVRISTMIMEPQPRSMTDRGGNRMASITLQKLIVSYKYINFGMNFSPGLGLKNN